MSEYTPVTRPATVGQSKLVPVTRPATAGQSKLVPVTRPQAAGQGKLVPVTRPQAAGQGKLVPVPRPQAAGQGKLVPVPRPQAAGQSKLVPVTRPATLNPNYVAYERTTKTTGYVPVVNPAQPRGAGIGASASGVPRSLLDSLGLGNTSGQSYGFRPPIPAGPPSLLDFPYHEHPDDYCGFVRPTYIEIEHTPVSGAEGILVFSGDDFPGSVYLPVLFGQGGARNPTKVDIATWNSTTYESNWQLVDADPAVWGNQGGNPAGVDTNRFDAVLFFGAAVDLTIFSLRIV